MRGDLLYNEYVILPEYTEFRNLKWTIREEQRLFNCYPYNLPKDILRLLFPDRSNAAIKHKTLEFGLRRGNHKRWTSEEEQLLADLISKMGLDWDNIQPLLPDRTRDSIMSRWYKEIRK